jgi:hypothetical protein
MEKWHAKQMKSEITGVAILRSDKWDFKPKLFIKYEDNHSILIKGTIQQEDIIIPNIYAPNVGAHNFVKHCWI